MNKMNPPRSTRAKKAVDDVIEEATATAKRVRASATKTARRASSRAADTIDDLDDDLHEVVDETRGRVGRAADRVSHAAHDLADNIRERDLITDVQDFARRNPGVMLVGAVLAGVALSQLVRRSDRT